MSFSNERLEGIAGRIDKVDLLFYEDFDRWQQIAGDLSALCESIQEDTGVGFGFRVRCYGVQKETNKRIYGVSTWGAACDDLLGKLPSHYYPNISRVDFRIESEICEGQFTAYKQRLQEHNPKNRNIVDYSTRARNKEFARNAGGRGVAFGSHKSDVRLTAYKRSGEAGAVEIQISGDHLHNIVSISAKMAAELGGPSFYAAVCDRIVPYLDGMSKEAGFKSILGMLAFLGESEFNLSYAEKQEYDLAQALSAFKSMPVGTQADFLEAIGVRTTGATIGITK